MLYLPYPVGKVCRKCGEWKPFAQLTYKRHCTDGFDALCKACMHKRAAEWRKEHPDRAHEINRTYYQRHKDETKPKRAAWFKHWRAKNVDTRRRKNREYMKQYNLVHGHRLRFYKTEGTLTKADVRSQYKRQKGRCYYDRCGHASLKDGFHIEHVVPVSRGGTNSPDNIVLACPACNRCKSDKLPHEWPEGGRLL